MFKRLFLLNGFAILGVVFAHAATWGLSAMFEWTDRYLPVTIPNYDQINSITYYILISIRQLSSFAVPAFLFVSGFFIAYAAGGSRADLKWNVVATRMKNLIVPLVIWISIRYILLRRPPSTLSGMLMSYYYVVLVLQCYLLSPIIVPVAKSSWKILLLVTALFHFSLEGLRYLKIFGISFPGSELLLNITPPWLFLLWVFWFALGVVAGVHRQQFNLWLSKYKRNLLIVCAVSAVLAPVEYVAITHFTGGEWLGAAFPVVFSRPVYQTSLILVFLALTQFAIPFEKSIIQIGSKSLGVYLVNQNANYVAALFMYFLTPWVLGYQILYSSILVVVGLGAPLLLMEIVRRSPGRKYYRYLFG